MLIPRSKKSWLVFAIALIMGTAGFMAIWPAGQRRVSKSCFDEVRVGMTKEEVISILGTPEPQAFKVGMGGAENVEYWADDKDPAAPAMGAMAEIRFDIENKVTDLNWFWPQADFRPGFCDRVAGWLGLALSR